MIHSYHRERRARYSTQCESVQTSGPQAHIALRGWRKVGHMHFAERLDRNISRSVASRRTRFAHRLRRQEQDSKPRNALNVTVWSRQSKARSKAALLRNAEQKLFPEIERTALCSTEVEPVKCMINIRQSWTHCTIDPLVESERGSQTKLDFGSSAKTQAWQSFKDSTHQT